MLTFSTVGHSRKRNNFQEFPELAGTRFANKSQQTPVRNIRNMEAAGDPSGRLRTRSGRAGRHRTFQPQQQTLTGLIIYKVTPENCFVFNKHLKLEEECFLIQDSYAINTSQKPGLQDNKNMQRHIQAKKPQP